MGKTHYELLGVAPDAPAEEIKHAFRREIAKYHPDKVQHLGQEFQEIAAVRAAELTQAYKTLTDASLRADYDGLLGATTADAAPAPAPAPAASPSTPPAQPRSPEAPRETPAPESHPESTAAQFTRERAGARQFVSRAAIARFRSALDAECPGAQPFEVAGFDAGCLPKGSFFSFKLPPRLLARQVAVVDAAAVADVGAALGRLKKDSQRDLCIFLLGQEVAPPSALAGAVTELRRRAAGLGGTLYLVPLSTEDWRALVPAEAPELVRAILKRLKP